MLLESILVLSSDKRNEMNNLAVDCLIHFNLMDQA